MKSDSVQLKKKLRFLPPLSSLSFSWKQKAYLILCPLVLLFLLVSNETFQPFNCCPSSNKAIERGNENENHCLWFSSSVHVDKQASRAMTTKPLNCLSNTQGWLWNQVKTKQHGNRILSLYAWFFVFEIQSLFGPICSWRQVSREITTKPLNCCSDTQRCLWKEVQVQIYFLDSYYICMILIRWLLL